MKKTIMRIAAMMLAAVMMLGCMTVNAKPKTTTKSELNFNFEEHHVTNREGIDLYGELYLPVEEQEKYPFVIFCHGLGSNANAVAHQAKYFAHNGIAAYVFDVDNGGVGCRSGKADGDMTQLSPRTVCNDLSDVIDHFQALPFVDTDNLFLGGVSMGGFMSAYVAGERPDEIRGIMLQSPGFSLTDKYQGYASADELPETEEVRGMVLGRRFGADAMEMDVYATIANFKKDVLMAHGDKDDIVDISYAQKAAEVFENVTFHVYEGADHGFGGEYRTRFEGEMLEFVKNILGE